MAPPAKRRIQPQLLSPSEAASPAAGFAVPSALQGPLSSHKEERGHTTAPEWEPPGVREDSEYAAKTGAKGRRIYVELDAPSKEINWKKLLKAQGVTQSKLRKQPAQDPSNAGERGLPEFPQIPLQSSANNPLASVIARLERQYVVPTGDNDSTSEGGDEEMGEGGSDDHSGDDSGAEQVSDGEYDYEDEWIDDSEFAAFVEGDRRKPKHSGFFINKGEIEKTDEDLPLSVWESPPKKRRKKKTGAAPEEGVATGNPDMQQENEAEEPGAEQAKKKRKKMLSSSNDATKSGKKLRQTTLRMMPPAAAAEPPATDAVPQPPSLAVQAAIAGSTASGLLPQPPSKGAANHALDSVPAGDGTSLLSAEMQSALASLTATAEATKQEEQQNPGSVKAIPKGLNAVLAPFACLLAKEAQRNSAAREAVLDAVVAMFDPLFTRTKFIKRLESLAKGITDDLASAATKIREHLEAKLKAADEQRGSSEVPPAPEAFQWDKNLEHQILVYTNLHVKANGRAPEDSGAALAELLGFWPAGRMSPAVLQAAVERARHNPKAVGSTRSVAQRRSLDSTDASAVAEAREGSAEAARALLPSISEEPAADEAERLPGPVAGPSAAPADAVTLMAQPSMTGELSSQPAPGPLPPSIEVADLPAYAIGLGASPEQIADSIRAAGSAGKYKPVVNKVLMLAGPKGYTSQEIVDKANELKLTGDQPWDASKKASITHNIRTFEYHIAIGNLRYAHKAFPGVTEMAAKEQEALEAKKKAKEDQAAALARPATTGAVPANGRDPSPPSENGVVTASPEAATNPQPQPANQSPSPVQA